MEMTNKVAQQIFDLVQKGTEQYKQEMDQGLESDSILEGITDCYYMDVYALLAAYGLKPDVNFLYNLVGISSSKEIELYYNKTVNTAKLYH